MSQKNSTNYQVTPNTQAVKLGDRFGMATYTSKDTCPPTCEHMIRKTCYAMLGPTSWHWNKVSNGEYGGDLESLLKAIKHLRRGTVWRYAVAGDLPGQGICIDTIALEQITEANKGLKGYAYTHKPVFRSQYREFLLKDYGITRKFFNKQVVINRKAIIDANVGGFTINYSADSLAVADRARNELNWPTVLSTPVDTKKPFKTPKGNQVAMCPFDIAKIPCSDCGNEKPLCANSKRKAIIGFVAHGSRKKLVTLE
jgi:hypothetical protein